MILALILVVAAALGLLVLAWSSQLIVSSSYLQASQWTQNNGSYSADLLDHNVNVGGISVIGSNLVTLGATEIPVTVSIWHYSGTVKSVELIFSTDGIANVALDVLEGGPWPSVQFHRTSDGTGVAFSTGGLGFVGEGTVTLGFFLEMDYGQQSINYNFYFKLILQNDVPFTFSNQVAETQVSIQYSRA